MSSVSLTPNPINTLGGVNRGRAWDNNVDGVLTTISLPCDGCQSSQHRDLSKAERFDHAPLTVIYDVEKAEVLRLNLKTLKVTTTYSSDPTTTKLSFTHGTGTS